MKIIVEDNHKRIAEVELDQVLSPPAAPCYFATFGIRDGGKKYQVSVRITELDVLAHTARLMQDLAALDQRCISK